MLTFLSVVTAVKDYVDVVHTIMDKDPMWTEIMTSYFDPGATLTYGFLFCKEFLINLFTFGWLSNVPLLPTLVPEVTRSMLTELSVFDTPALRFPNMFTFLETPISYGSQNVVAYSLEKFIIGLINSLFFCLPTSFAHIVCMRRFVMQGVEAGYLAGLGTIAGNLVWISCIVLGFRAIVIPWISLDMLRYVVGLALVVKYLWDSYSDRRVVLTAVDEVNVFALNFCLAFLEQSMVFPFISNLSIGSDATLIESFPTDNIFSFFLVHFAYLGGLLLGSLTLLQGACWFWENPAFSFYMWAMSTLKMSTLTYYRLCNFFFLYASMFFAMANLAYFGTDYLVTKPLGYVPNDRILSGEYVVLESSYLGSKASSRNTRMTEGRHNRRERWKRRHKRFRMFDATLYDDGIYDLFTIEDLNYGFHKFWLRRKMRNHKSNYRILPKKQVRMFKQELGRTKLENFMGPRFEFTRMLFENAYHPTFHRYQTNQQPKKTEPTIKPFNVLTGNQVTSAYALDNKVQITEDLRHNNSALRKFVRRLKLRMTSEREPLAKSSANPLYSKRWRHLFSRIYHRQLRRNNTIYQLEIRPMLFGEGNSNDLNDARVPLSDRDRQLLRYKTFIKQKTGLYDGQYTNGGRATPALTAVHPLSFYLKREEAFKRKLETYGPSVRRGPTIGANLHAFIPMTKRLFYYHKPTNRWERGMQVARATRKRVRNTRYQEFDISDIDIPTRADYDDLKQEVDAERETNPNRFTYPTDYYALISKRAGRIRHQIFKDVLQHWYYSPYNRFLVQWDMDSFIRRQPRSYFVNKEDEKQLHLRRFLLNDYFQTFRWYARMDQYHIMKQRIGGTKSFQSRVYNQQFQGTFKKVRHLFAVTPTLETQPILKFDQPLFNEYPNTTNKPITAQSFIHEELNLEPQPNRALSRELWDQAALAVALALTKQQESRNNYTNMQLEHYNNPGRVNRFMLRGKKNRGIEPSSGARRHLNEEANFLEMRTRPLSKFDPRPYVDELWLRLFDRAAEYIYDEDLVKDAIEDYADDFYEEDGADDVLLDKRLDRLKKWAVFMNTTTPNQAKLLSGLTQVSSMAIKDVLYFQNDLPKDRLNPRKSRPLYPERYNKLTEVKKILKQRYQQRYLDNLKTEQKVATKVAEVVTSPALYQPRSFFIVDRLRNAILSPFKAVGRGIKVTVGEIQDRFLAPTFAVVSKPFRARPDPDFYYWSKMEEADDLESDVLYEIDPLRRRFKKRTKKTMKERFREEGIQSARRQLKKEKVPIISRKFYELKKEKYQKLLKELDRKAIRAIPKTFQKNHEDDLKFVREYADEIRQMQRRNLKFYLDYTEEEMKLAQQEFNRKRKLKDRVFNTPEEKMAQEREDELRTQYTPRRWRELQANAKDERRIQALESQGKLLEADILRVKATQRDRNQRRARALYDALDQSYEAHGYAIDPEVPLKVGRLTSRIGDIPWFNWDREPPEGQKFELQVPLTVYRRFGDSLADPFRKKRDLYDTLRSKRAKRYRQWKRLHLRDLEQEDEEFTSEESPTLFDRINDFFTGGVDVEEDPLGGAVPLEVEYGTMGLADTNEEFIQERNSRKFELLDEYTRARKEGDPKAKEMQEKVLRSLTGKPDLKLEDRFVPLQDDEAGQFEAEGELNWWEDHKWPLYAENVDLMYLRPPVSAQTEFENIADEAYREVKRQQLHRWWWQEFIPQLRGEDYSKVLGRENRKLSKALKIAARQNLLEQKGDQEYDLNDIYQPYAPTGEIKPLGDRDYKPLQSPTGASTLSDVLQRDYSRAEDGDQLKKRKEANALNRVTQEKVSTATTAAPNSKQWVSSTPAPFYVGWDETARQFVVTNRYLSREESGYQMNWNANFPIFNNERNLSPDYSETMPFSKYPFKGLSANTTIYNKVLFASYDADQFFNLGLDGFTPLGWRKFKFSYTAPRVQPLLVHSVETSNVFQVFDKKRPFNNLVQHYVNPYLFKDNAKKERLIEKEEEADIDRSHQQEFESVSSHPQLPALFPTGPLLTEVLPTHYVFTLFQRYRFPNARYVDYLPNYDDVDEKYENPDGFDGGGMSDFTLRKRPIPQRMYRSKNRPLNEDELLPSRQSFVGAPGEPQRRRPGTYPSEANFAARLKEADEGRVRTLRRRVLRQTQRPQMRYPPIVGGFVWAGDSLRLAQTDGELATTPQEREKIKQKAIVEGRPVPPSIENPEPLTMLPLWNPQTRHVMIEEHNRKVLKRRLEHTQNKAFYYQKLKFYRFQNADPEVI